jgi:subtilisin family serine protease
VGRTVEVRGQAVELDSSRCPWAPGRRGALALGVLLALVASVVMPATTSAAPADGAAEPATEAASPNGRTAPHRPAAPPPVPTGDLASFADEAADEAVLVELTLTVGFGPEPTLPAADVRSQRAEIARAQAQVRRALRGTSHEIVHELDSVPALTVRLSAAAVDALQETDAVASIRHPRVLAPADELGEVVTAESEEEAVASPTLAESGVLIGSRRANVAGWDGGGRAVAVIDTGVESAHPFFGGRVVAEACFSAGGDCPDGSTSMQGAGAGAPCVFHLRCSHGTHVAGIASGDDGEELAGVAPASDIIAINASYESTNGPPMFTEIDIVASLEHVYTLRGEHDIASVNLSLGGGRYPGTCDDPASGYDMTVANLTAAGIAVVAASGNNGYDHDMAWPACQSQTISVGNTTKDDGINASSNSSAELDLLAPGTQITSAVLEGNYAPSTGTSMAAPQVAGAVAVLADALPGGPPGGRVGARVDLLEDTGVPITDTRQGRIRARIDLAAALEDRFGRCPLNDPYEPNDDPASAYRLWYDETVDALICEDDTDVYDIHAFAGEDLEVDLDHETGGGDLELRLHAPDGTLLDDSASGGGTAAVGAAVTETGFHRITVVGEDPGVEAAYELSATQTGCPVDDPYEPNQNLSQASDFRLEDGETIHARLCDDGDPPRDGFSIDASEGDLVTASLFHEPDLGGYDADGTRSMTGQLQVAVLRPDGSGRVSTGTGRQRTMSVTAEQDGIHHVFVRGHAGSGWIAATNPLYRLSVAAREVNHPPVAVDDELVAARNTPATIDVLANDHDPDGDPLEVIAFDTASQQGGEVACEAEGRCTYTPPEDHLGGDAFTYTIADPGGETDTATVRVTVVEELEPTGTLRGTVSDTGGAAIDGASVTAGGAHVAQTARTGAGGAYELELPPGTYDVEVDADGFAPRTFEDVEIVVDAPTTLHAVLSALPGAVAGTVVDAHTGQALPGVTIALDGRTTTSAGDGTFALHDLPAGTHELTAAVDDHHPHTQTVTITAGHTTDLEIGLTRARACIDGRVPPAGFTDTDGNVHTPAIDCMAWYDIVRGIDHDRYAPRGQVTRAQMGSMIARMIDATHTDLPDASHPFTDLDGNVHQDAIARLAAAGVVNGRTPTTYHPAGPVTRAQSVAMLVRAHAYVTGQRLPAGPRRFDDILDSVHRADIEAAAHAQIAHGVSDTRFNPNGTTTRDQMASLVARTLDRIATEIPIRPPDATR